MVRRNVSLPAHLAESLEAEAKERGLTFSALLAEKAAQPRRRFDWVGSVSDDPDLSLKLEEILRRLDG